MSAGDQAADLLDDVIEHLQRTHSSAHQHHASSDVSHVTSTGGATGNVSRPPPSSVVVSSPSSQTETTRRTGQPAVGVPPPNPRRSTAVGAPSSQAADNSRRSVQPSAGAPPAASSRRLRLGDWQDSRRSSESSSTSSDDDSDSGFGRSGSVSSLVEVSPAPTANHGLADDKTARRNSATSAGTAGDTNTLPFANENVGTIKQRGQSTSSGASPGVATVGTGGSGTNCESLSDKPEAVKSNMADLLPHNSGFEGENTGEPPSMR